MSSRISCRFSLTLALLLLVACGGGSPDEAGGHGGQRGSGGRDGRGGPGGPGAAFAAFGAADATAAVPVEISAVVRRDIADYIETNGTLEAENEVDIVARINGPITELNVEEGMTVREGDVLARIDADEILAQLGIASVALEEARLALERARASHEAEIISQELFDQAQSRFDSAAAQLKGTEILLGYTKITAPFAGLIIERSIKYAEHVTTNQKLFRLSDFNPLLCPIQIPEKDLRKLRSGQNAYITVESFPGDRFPARVLRISPVIDSGTGTFKVTLEVQAVGRLRPGMFASVFLETDVHENALVMAKSALVLESIGDTVYVKDGEQASRREVELGFEEADAVEVLAGVEEGEQVIVIGQDGLSNGTPVYILSASSVPSASQTAGGADGWSAPTGGAPGAGQPPRGGGEGDEQSAAGRPGRGLDPANLSAERIERMKERMRQLGLGEEQIDERIRQMKDGTFVPPGRPGGRPPRGDS